MMQLNVMYFGLHYVLLVLYNFVPYLGFEEVRSEGKNEAMRKNRGAIPAPAT